MWTNWIINIKRNIYWYCCWNRPFGLERIIRIYLSIVHARTQTLTRTRTPRTFHWMGFAWNSKWMKFNCIFPPLKLLENWFWRSCALLRRPRSNPMSLRNRRSVTKHVIASKRQKSNLPEQWIEFISEKLSLFNHIQHHNTADIQGMAIASSRLFVLNEFNLCNGWLLRTAAVSMTQYYRCWSWWWWKIIISLVPAKRYLFPCRIQ